MFLNRFVVSAGLLLTLFSAQSPLFAQEENSPWSVEKTKQAPAQNMPEPVLTPNTTPQVPDNQNCEIPATQNETNTQTTTATTPQTDSEIEAFLQDQTINSSWRRAFALGRQRFEKGQFSAAINAFKQAQKAALKDSEHPALSRASSKSLIKSYISMKDYPSALQALTDSFPNEWQSGSDQEIGSMKSQLDKSYRLIDVAQFSPKAKEVLDEAQVQKIEVFPYFEADKTLVKVTSAKRFVKDTGSSDVPKIGLNKIVSFEFSEMPGQGFKIGNITGFQILAKMWVNLVESIFNTVNVETPTAQVTAEKMGFSKTVSVNIPDKVFKSLNVVLDRVTTELHSATVGGTR